MKMGPRFKERRDPFINLSGLAKYMSATDAAQRSRILESYKYPEPEGYAQADFYGPARDGIRAYHVAGNDPTVLDERRDKLESLLPSASAAEALKIEHNVRVLRGYHQPFGALRLTPIQYEAAALSVEGVAMNLRPDLLAVEKRQTKVIRFG